MGLTEFNSKEVPCAEYDREEVIATITISVTARELKMLELALFRHWLGQVDIEGNADATYYMWMAAEIWNMEVKDNGMDSD